MNQLSGKTIAEKIIRRAAGHEVTPGEITVVKIDLALMPDTTPRRISKDFSNLGVKLFNGRKVVLVMDHYCPPKDVKEAEIESHTRKWAKAVGIENIFEFEGVCHVVVAERGCVAPAMMMVGSDSHTCTSGALGLFAMGIGATDMLGVLATGETWLVVPETIAIQCDGSPVPGVMAKDISLFVLKELGIGGAEGSVLEFRGEGIRKLNMDERFTLTNMSVETGATTAIIEPDSVTMDYIRSNPKSTLEPQYSDSDANYKSRINCSINDLVPLVACPDQPDRVIEASKLENVRINQAYIGSCTGGKYYDLMIAAQILKGKTIAPWLRLLICPASKEILKLIIKEGILSILLDAGATLVTPGCGACAGHRDGILADGEVCISSTNRNFKGRMGSSEARIYLASPATVAASALVGYIRDPRYLLK